MKLQIYKFTDRPNEFRHPELYKNSINWYRDTINQNIENNDKYAGKVTPGWRLTKLEYAIRYREAGNSPISDKEYESDIKKLIDELEKI